MIPTVGTYDVRYVTELEERNKHLERIKKELETENAQLREALRELLEYAYHKPHECMSWLVDHPCRCGYDEARQRAAALLGDKDSEG